MMLMGNYSLLLALIVGVAHDAPRGNLVGDPTVTRTADGCEIGFMLTAPNDVTVRILDARGNTVRHLVAAMVGLDKAASPLADHSLVQKITWDSKDDTGSKVAAEGCRVLLGVGTRAKFDKFILWNPDGFACLGATSWSSPGSMAVGPKGELYLVQQYGVHYSSMQVFDRQGHLIRSVWPLSMNKPKEVIATFLQSTMTIWPGDVAPWGATDYEGRTVPRSVMHSAFYWYGVKSVSLAAGPRGDLFLVDWFPNFTWMYHVAGTELPESIATSMPWQDGTRLVSAKLVPRGRP